MNETNEPAAANRSAQPLRVDLGNKKSTTNEPEAANLSPEPILVDLGKKSKRSIRKLRRGRGKLMERVTDAIEELRSAGTIEERVQPLIIIVRERKDVKGGLFG